MPKSSVLYKYTTAEVGLKILETQTIRFSNPKTFNDPYDCNMPIIFNNSKELNSEFFINLNKKVHNYVSLDQETINKLNNELQNLENSDIFINPNQYLDIILQPLKDDMRVLSLSKTNNNLLMWGHYAKNHTGIAIGFNTNYKFFKHPIKIKYSHKIPKLKNYLINDLCLTNHNALQELRLLFHTKSIDWKYEQEFRFEIGLNHLYKEFISSPKNISLFPKFFEEIKNKNDFIHPYIAPECVNSVYIGLYTNIIDCYKIISIVRNKYPHAKIYRAFLSKNEFKVEFEEIEK